MSNKVSKMYRTHRTIAGVLSEKKNNRNIPNQIKKYQFK